MPLLFTRSPLPEVARTPILAAVDEIVKARGAKHKIALQHEIPQHRHQYRHTQTRYRETQVSYHANLVEIGTVVEQIGEKLCAKCVEQHAAKPYHEKLYADGRVGAFAQSERKLIVDRAIDYTSGYGTHRRCPGRTKSNPRIQHKARRKVDKGGDLRGNYRPQKHEDAPAVKKFVGKFAHIFLFVD
jgi:hypothetical protein